MTPIYLVLEDGAHSDPGRKSADACPMTEKPRLLTIPSPLRRRVAMFPPLGMIAGAALKAGVLLQECQRHVAGWSIALFRDDQFCFAGALLFCFVICLVVLRPDKESDEVGILFN